MRQAGVQDCLGGYILYVRTCIYRHERQERICGLVQSRRGEERRVLLELDMEINIFTI
jgi:hypothetical protein